MRFIHTGDIHLGAEPDSGRPWSRTRRDEIWNTFRGIIEKARTEQVDLLLIAGDLFHARPTEAQLKEVNYLFETIPRTRVVLMAGNHDFIEPGNPYPVFPWASNVSGLFSEQCECLRFPEIQTEVYGFSYYDRKITEPLYDSLEPLPGRYFHILLAHGGDEEHIPIHREALEKSRFDYIALGHIHQPQDVLPRRALYCGSPEPVDCGEYGPHGYVFGEMKKGRLTVERIPCACREYRKLRVSCSMEDTTYSLADRIRREIRETGEQHLYRIVLEGSRDPGVLFDLSMLRESGWIVDVTDLTVPEFHLDELKERYRGRLIERFIRMYESEFTSESGGEDAVRQDPVGEKAFSYALEALLLSRQRKEHSP